MSGLYGKLNKEVEKVSLRGGETPTASVRVEDNIIYVDHKADRVLDATSDRPVQNKTLASRFANMDASLLHMKESFEEQWALIRHLHNVVEEQVKLVAQYNQESIERDAELLEKILELKAGLERDIANLANFIARYEEELSHLKASDAANENAINALRAAYEIKMAELDATDASIRADIKNFKEVYDETVDALKDEDYLLHSRIDDLTAQYNQKMSELDAKDAEIVQSILDAVAQHNRDISTLTEKHTSEISALTEKHDSEMASLESKHDSDIATVRQEHADSVASLTSKHDSDIAAVRQEHSDSVASLTTKHNEDISSVRQEHSDSVVALESKYDTKISEITNKHNTELSNLNSSLIATIGQLESKHDIEVSAMTSKYDSKIAEVEAKHASDKASMESAHNQDVADINQSIAGLDSKYQGKVDELIAADEANAQALESHNNDTGAHSYIQGLINELDARLDAFLGDGDAAAALSDLLEYLQNNGDLIESLDANKINYSDIVDNLTTEATDKPLSANQGVQLAASIEAMRGEMSDVVDVKLEKIEADLGELTKADEELDYEIKLVKSSMSELSDTVYNELSSLLEIDFITGGTAPIDEE